MKKKKNVGPNPWSPMYDRFFCNRIIYNGKVRIKYLSRIMFMNSQLLLKKFNNGVGSLRLVKSCIHLATSSKYV